MASQESSQDNTIHHNLTVFEPLFILDQRSKNHEMNNPRFSRCRETKPIGRENQPLGICRWDIKRALRVWHTRSIQPASALKGHKKWRSPFKLFHDMKNSKNYDQSDSSPRKKLIGSLPLCQCFSTGSDSGAIGSFPCSKDAWVVETRTHKSRAVCTMCI